MYICLWLGKKYSTYLLQAAYTLSKSRTMPFFLHKKYHKAKQLHAKAEFFLLMFFIINWQKVERPWPFTVLYPITHWGGFSQHSPWGSQENPSQTDKIPTLSLIKATLLSQTPQKSPHKIMSSISKFLIHYLKGIHTW